MARIPGAELVRLRAGVSVARLVEGCGVELRLQGADLVGCCPFHAEVTALEAAAEAGLTPARLVTSWNICASCQAVIEDTSGVLTSLRGALFPWLTNATSYNLTKPLWNRASARFAEGARDPAHVFFGPGAPRSASIFTTIEEPILIRNSVELIPHGVG